MVAVPITVTPCRRVNVTVPSFTTAVLVTLAVRFTDWPLALNVAVAAAPTVVVPVARISECVASVEVRMFAVPLYTASIVKTPFAVPAGRV